MMTPAHLAGLYVGTPRELPGFKAPWTSAFGRAPVEGRLALGPDGLPGDAVANTIAHGGPDRALLAYPQAHYAAWRAQYPGHAFAEPAFGENLLVAGLDEATCCIGDVWAVGSARLQVTMPRWPCAKIAQFNLIPDLLAQVMATGRIGWLLRVLEAGELGAGDAIALADHPAPDWTVARAYRVFGALRANDPDARDEARALGAVPGLAASWREGITGALA